MSKPKPATPLVQMPLRVPESLRTRLNAHAARQGMSLNEMCTQALQKRADECDRAAAQAVGGGMITHTTYYENGRRVTDWRWEARQFPDGYNVVRTRWFYDARPGHECWDQEAEWTAAEPLSREDAEALAAALNEEHNDG